VTAVFDLDNLGPSAREDVQRYVKAMNRAELEAIAFHAEWNRRKGRLRDIAAMEGVNPDQLSLINMHTDLPSAIRYINIDGEEDFKHRDLASLDELIANEEWTLERCRTRVGISERRLQRLWLFAEEQGERFDMQAPIGPHIWRNVLCAICGDPWRERDPFEKAHDISVAAGAGANVTRYAHRSCNRAEGVG
jgi:DNA-binding Xre family transcriptional regulator